jgi:fucose permease
LVTKPSLKNHNTQIVGIAFLGFVIVGFNAGLLAVAWPSIRDMFGVSQDAIGALFFASTIAALIISLNSGPIISQLGLGRFLAAGCLLSALGFLGFALAPSWWWLILTTVVSSFGTSAIVVGLNTFFAISQSAKLMAWLQACFGLGGTLSPLVLSRLLDAGQSWQWGYYPLVALYGTLAVFFGLTLPHWRLAAQDSSVADGTPAPQLRGRETLRLPMMWWSILLFFTVTGMEGTASQWPYTLFTEARAVPPNVAGLWVSLYWAASTVGRILFGIVVDRIGAVRLVRLAMSAAICGATLITLNVSDRVSLAGLTLTGLALSPLFPVLTSGTPVRVGRAHAANAIGYQQAAVRLGLAAVPALAGSLAEAWSLEVTDLFMLGVALVMFVLHEETVRHQGRPSQKPNITAAHRDISRN